MRRKASSPEVGCLQKAVRVALSFWTFLARMKLQQEVTEKSGSQIYQRSRSFRRANFDRLSLEFFAFKCFLPLQRLLAENVCYGR
jgi:hypothetical protein